MKKFILALLVAATAFAAVPVANAADRQPGGFAAGVVGCCFGMRTAAAWNEGKGLHLHDILDLIWVGRVWSAIEGYSGKTASQLHEEAPTYF